MAAIDDAMSHCWGSTNATESRPGIFPIGQGPNYNSGIAAAWRELYRSKQVGPPITKEYDSVDWGGKHIVVQEFPGARCEWDGQAHWIYR